MNRLTKEQIKEIKKLKSEGKEESELSELFNVSKDTIIYHTNEEVKNNRINKSKKYFKDLTTEKRKHIYKNRKDSGYFKEYQKNKYHSNEEYRLRMIEAQKKSKKKKKGENEQKNKETL